MNGISRFSCLYLLSVGISDMRHCQLSWALWTMAKHSTAPVSRSLFCFVFLKNWIICVCAHQCIWVWVFSEKVLNPLELELLVIVSFLTLVLETELGKRRKHSWSPNHLSSSWVSLFLDRPLRTCYLNEIAHLPLKNSLPVPHAFRRWEVHVKSGNVGTCW